MAKKKKEVCPYCGNSFAYLSRHKCKVKDRVEGSEDSDKSDVERREERREERKKEEGRNLRRSEKTVLDIISKEKEVYFEDLLNLTNLNLIELDKILDVLELQSKIKVNRELIDASWTKHISLIEEINVDVKDLKIDPNKIDFILDIFSYQPCLTCPFSSKCNDTNVDQFNPHHCIWLSEWINEALEGRVYRVNFDEIQTELVE
ncbi:MAG: hypothetical protein EAX89_00465 [Candidatus Lokiarchaeota archaeon]|nr:hypothetical protein [Candidatus Lokiarchaeota archaeon]